MGSRLTMLWCTCPSPQPTAAATWHSCHRPTTASSPRHQLLPVLSLAHQRLLCREDWAAASLTAVLVAATLEQCPEAAVVPLQQLLLQEVLLRCQLAVVEQQALLVVWLLLPLCRHLLQQMHL